MKESYVNKELELEVKTFVLEIEKLNEKFKKTKGAKEIMDLIKRESDYPKWYNEIIQKSKIK